MAIQNQCERFIWLFKSNLVQPVLHPLRLNIHCYLAYCQTPNHWCADFIWGAESMDPMLSHIFYHLTLICPTFYINQKQMLICKVGQIKYIDIIVFLSVWYNLLLLLQMVGPVLVEDAKPLSKDLRHFLDQGLSDGHHAVYVSMGTLARLPEEELQSMAAALSALLNPVLWKLDPAHLPGKPLLFFASLLMLLLLFLHVGHLH